MPALHDAIPIARRGLSFRPPRTARPRPPRIVVLGDLVLDVVLRPQRPLEPATDVPGLVLFRQGGSAANVARWTVRLGARSTLVTAVGRDAIGRRLVAALEAAGVAVRAHRAPGARTGRIGIVVDPGGERSFVADRGAADALAPAHLDPAWFRADALHLPAYSLLGESLGQAARAAVGHARGHGALVSVDLASVGPLLAVGRAGAWRLLEEVRPAILFATRAEADVLLGGRPVEELLGLAEVVALKIGPKGATVLALENGERLRLEVATTPLPARESTGAGDAFDAGFLVRWLTARAAVRALPVALREAAVAGNRAAARQLATPPAELKIG